MKASIAQIKAVIGKLPHIPSRVPYTYHHDYARTHFAAFSGRSRAYVAMTNFSEEELWALALCAIADHMGLHALLHSDLSKAELDVVGNCYEYAKSCKCKYAMHNMP